MSVRFWSLAVLFATINSSAMAGYITVYGGPRYSLPTDTPVTHNVHVNISGTAGATGVEDIGSSSQDSRAFRWGTGGSITELGTLGFDSAGKTTVRAHDMDASGAIFGFAEKHRGGTFQGRRAVLWDAGSTVPIELENLSTSSGYTESTVNAANPSGLAVGYASKQGYRAVRWDAGQTTVTELGHLGTNPQGQTVAVAAAVNAGGTVVGRAQKHNGYISLGTRAVRWDAGTTVATELDELGTASADSINTTVSAMAVDDAGNAYGHGPKIVDRINYGRRAIRWAAGGTAATELGNLGTSASGYTSVEFRGVHADGTAVGYASKYENNANMGTRAVIWEPGSTDAMELPFLTYSVGTTDAGAESINSHGIIVGAASDFANGQSLGFRAVLWRGDHSIVNLNSLIDPASGWTLIAAQNISDTNFVTGFGEFDPDGPGPLEAYSRAFLLDATSAIPEPTACMVLTVVALILRRRR